MSTSLPERRSRWLLVILVVIWGASWPAIKMGVTSVPPLWFACFRYVVAMACLIAVAALQGELILPSPSDWRLIAVSGVLQMAMYSALTAVALTRLPPGRSSVLAFSTPLWVVPLSVRWLGEPLSWKRLAGVGTGLVGVLMIASPGLHATGHGQLAPYILLLGAAAGWAFAIVFVRAHRFQASALSLAPWQMLVAALLLLPCAIGLNGELPSLDQRGLLTLAYVGPVATAFAYWAMVEIGRYVRATTVSMALMMVPCVGLLISAQTFKEAVDVPLILGFALIGAGVLLTVTELSPTPPGNEAVVVR